MSIFSRLLGTNEAASEMIDMVKRAGDALVYTEEEKDDNKAKFFEKSSQVLIDWLQSSQGHRLSRRVIALSFTFIYLFEHLVSMAMNVASVWVVKPEKLVKTADIMASNAETMQGPIMLILGFYFAAPYIPQIVKPAMDKFTQKKDLG